MEPAGGVRAAGGRSAGPGAPGAPQVRRSGAGLRQARLPALAVQWRTRLAGLTQAVLPHRTGSRPRSLAETQAGAGNGQQQVRKLADQSVSSLLDGELSCAVLRQFLVAVDSPGLDAVTLGEVLSPLGGYVCSYIPDNTYRAVAPASAAAALRGHAGGPHAAMQPPAALQNSCPAPTTTRLMLHTLLVLPHACVQRGHLAAS